MNSIGMLHILTATNRNDRKNRNNFCFSSMNSLRIMIRFLYDVIHKTNTHVIHTENISKFKQDITNRCLEEK